jgi:hypothetical protein
MSESRWLVMDNRVLGLVSKYYLLAIAIILLPSKT